MKTPKVYSIDPELNAAAAFAIRQLHRRPKRAPHPRRPKDGEVCVQGCCRYDGREKRWVVLCP